MADNLPTNADTQLRLVLDNMPGALIYTDVNQIIVVCNDRFKEMYRVRRDLRYFFAGVAGPRRRIVAKRSSTAHTDAVSDSAKPCAIAAL
jgi:PAS domain-containing protein